MVWSTRFVRIGLLVFLIVAALLVSGVNQKAHASVLNGNSKIARAPATQACSLPLTVTHIAEDLSPLLPFHVQISMSRRAIAPLLASSPWFNQFRSLLQYPALHITLSPVKISSTARWQRGLDALSLVVSCISQTTPMNENGQVG